MKKFFLLFLFTAFTANYLYSQNLDSLNQFTGWDESNPLYKIQKFKNEPITYSQLFESGDKLFTSDAALNFRIWDIATGKIIYSRYEPHLTPVYLFNDSIVVFRQNDKVKPDSSGSICVLNLNTDSIIAKSNEKYLGYFHLTFSKDCDNNLMINYGNNYDPYTQYYSMTFNLFNMVPISLKESVNTDFLCSNDKNKFIFEKSGYGYNHYNEKRWIYRVFNLVNKDTLAYHIENSAYLANPNDFLSVKKFNNNSKLAFITYYNKLYTFSMDSLKLLRETPLPSNYASFVVTPSDYLIFFNSSTSEFVRYYYAQNSICKYKIDINLNQSDIFLINHASEYLLISVYGNIVSIYKDSVDTQLPEIMVDKTNIIENESVKLTLNSIADIESVKWDFGDGTFSEELNPEHIYLDSGKYDVKLIYRTKKRLDTIFVEDMVNVEKIFYPRLKADKYYGTAPLSVNVKNITKDFPEDGVPEWIIDSTSAGKSDELNAILDTGTHKITLKFDYNMKTYQESIIIKVFNKNFENYQNLDSSKFEGYYSGGGFPSETRYHIYSVTPLNDDRFVLYYSIITNGHNADWEGYYANIISNSFDRIFSIPNVNKTDWNFCAFPNLGYMVCNNNEINIFNKNNKLLFTKKYDWRGKQIALLNISKFIGKLEGNDLEIYDKRLELYSKLALNQYVDLQDSIKQGFIIGVEKGDPSYFYIGLQTRDKFLILQFDNNLNFKNYILKNGNVIKIDKKGSNLFVNYKNSENQKYLLQLNDNYKIIRDYNLDKIEYESICANDSCFFLSIENLGNDKIDYLIKQYDFNNTSKEAVQYNFKTSYSVNPTNTLNFQFNDDHTIFLLFSLISFDTHGPTYYFKRFVFPDSIIPDSVPYPDPSDTTKSVTIIYKINTSFPNPAEDFVKIEVEILENPKVEVYDILGTIVPIEYSKTKRKDKDLYWINLALLPKGTYYYKITDGQKSFTGRFIKE